MKNGKSVTVHYVNFAAAGYTLSVTIHVVDRGDDDPIFTNRPAPLWTTCPVWIRPSTVIYTVNSVDKVEYGSEVYYRLEAGKSAHTLLIQKVVAMVVCCTIVSPLTSTWPHLKKIVRDICVWWDVKPYSTTALRKCMQFSEYSTSSMELCQSTLVERFLFLLGHCRNCKGGTSSQWRMATVVTILFFGARYNSYLL